MDAEILNKNVTFQVANWPLEQNLEEIRHSSKEEDKYFNDM